MCTLNSITYIWFVFVIRLTLALLNIQQARVHALLHHPDAPTQAYNPCIHLFHVSAEPAVGLEISAHVLLWLLEKRTHKDKASHAILGRAVQSESVAQRWLVHGMRKLLWNPFKQKGSNFWKSHESWRHPSQSQPLSFIMWDNSIMNLPSLYFWLSSNARSCKRNIQNNKIYC